MTLPEGARSVENVCDLEILPSPAAAGPIDLLFEVPHGATRRRDYESVRALLSPELPGDLIDYFFVNTDVGSYEYARRAAERIVSPRAPGSEAPPRRVAILRGLVPRTFIDVNRVIDTRSGAGESPLTAALGSYIRTEGDVETLVAMHRAYHDVAGRLYDGVLGAGGLAMTAHTYAPRTVSIDAIDEGIGRALRAAYVSEAYEKCPIRPEVDVIADDPDGRRLGPPALIDRLRAGYRAIGVVLAVNETYTLHPASMGHTYAAAHPGRVLCLEIRRDLLADPFTPFEEMSVGEKKLSRMAAPIAAAFLEELAS